ncbi:zinc finger protein 271 isoform X2 [Gadus morhua]|uniref:zinc finger protein 271 isoform X2 n=1 Tax=Gadus morhua TaxID=8049 RepID=UPI0011B75473|nr:zinc finger protein 271-like isoform X2 [Gadus morhua]
MFINMSPCGSTLEEQLSSIMDVLAKAAVSEISQLFLEGSTTLRLQITQSLKENEALRTRMKVMRSELFSLRLQTRSNASRAASRSAVARANNCKPLTKSLGNGLKPLMEHKAVGNSPYLRPSKSDASSATTPAEQHTPDTILIIEEEDIIGGKPSVEDYDYFGDCSTQRSATSESLHVDAPGSSHMSSHSGELRILSVHGQGEGPLAVDGHDTLFTVYKHKVWSSLSVDHSVAKSLDCGERLVCREERTVQQTPNSILIKDEEDISGGKPAVEDCGDIEDSSTQPSATAESLHVDAPGTSYMTMHRRNQRVHRKGEGPLAADGHDTLFSTSELEALSSLSADHSVAKSLDCGGVPLVHREELTGYRAFRKGQPCVECGKIFPNNAKMIIHMRSHTGEKPYGCELCKKRFQQKGDLKIHMRRIHSGEWPLVCPQCNASFRDSKYLRRHMIQHMGNGVP